jgi:hypothetical protein
MAGHARRNPLTSPRACGGLVSVTPIRDRIGEDGESYSVSWHSPTGDLRWLSPRISSPEVADAAAMVLSSFTGATKR